MAYITFVFSAVSGVSAASIAFNPALARLVAPKETPLQVRHVSESGRHYIFERSSNRELMWPIEFQDLPEADQTTPVSSAGYSALRAFLISNVNWSQRPFTVADPDGASADVRYWGGFETLMEAGGRSQRKGRWTGAVQLRKVL